MILDEKGSLIKKLCFGDGIENCITTADGKIIVSYFDEGIFGNYGWDEPIGASGLLVWDDEGNILWKNKIYDICDCYAINTDTSDRLWFYYYADFNLVCTDFNSDIVIHPDISGCNAFSLSETQQKILFSGGYGDLFCYLCSIDTWHGKISSKQKEVIEFQNKPIEKAIHRFCGSKFLFLMESSTLCGYHFI